jgi:endonuclease/exonuclease/phosphatase (EEP) superfamily protein YafD
MMFSLTAFLWVLSIFLVLATVLPFLKVAHGAVRSFAFLREQFFVLAVILAIVMPVLHPGALGWGVVAALIVSAGINLIYIVKFTPLWTSQSGNASKELRAQTQSHISVLAANVKQSNRKYGRLTALIQESDPDIALAVEVDEAWISALKSDLNGTYPHWIEVPKGNTYGMCLMSKLALSETDVRTLITEDVPSIRTSVHLRDGQKMRLYVVHPEPPVVTHDTIGRDSEIAMIGLEAKEDDLPCVVAGDLNDVAWSTTTRRFQRLSGLLDPRVGRGFYNTFHATVPLLRWPLDHLFHDPQFRLIEMSRLKKIGSDHFPMWFVLALAQTDTALSDPGAADASEVRDVKEMIEQERSRPRSAIGSDWEDDA